MGAQESQKLFLAGLITPHTDMTMEYDLHRLCPSVRLCTGRMYLETVSLTVEPILKMVRDEFPRIARQFADLPLDAVIFGSTAASAVGGVGADVEVRRSLTDLTGAKALSVLDAVVRSLHQTHATRILMVTPYPSSVTAVLFGVLEAQGVPVAHSVSMELRSDVAIGSVPIPDIIQFTEKSFTRAFDAVFISCTNLRAAEVAPTLSATLGVPVVTSNLAVAEQLNSLSSIATSSC